MRKISYDIDGVLCDFSSGLISVAHALGYHDFPTIPETIEDFSFNVGRERFLEVFNQIKDLESFWYGLPPMPEAVALKDRMIIDAYVTARPVESEVTKVWLEKWGFPYAPVYTVCHKSHDKLEIINQERITHHIDDKLETYQDINRLTPARCYLATHHRHYGKDLGEYPLGGFGRNFIKPYIEITT